VIGAFGAGALALLVPRSARPLQFEAEDIKTAMIGKIADFVTWPAEAGLEDPYRPLELVVLGDSPLLPRIRKHYERVRIGGHRVFVRQAHDVAEVERPHILFISSSFEDRLGEVMARVQGAPVLTVGDSDGFARRGVAVNMYFAGDGAHFEVSRRALESHRLRASFRLLALARLIDDQQARR